VLEANRLSVCIVLQSKMRHLKQHADGLLDTILNHPNMTEPQIHQMDAAQKEELQCRVQIADGVSHIHYTFYIQKFLCSAYCLKRKRKCLYSATNTVLFGIWHASCLTRPILHCCDALQDTLVQAEVLICSAVSCMQVIDGVINKLWDKNFDGAKIYQDYEKGLQELLSVITASSPGEHFQLPQQDSSQLAQVSFNFASRPHP